MPQHRIDAENGIIYGQAGRPIGSYLPTVRYIVIRRVDNGKPRLAHRMIWESVHGPIPAGLEINHINGIRTDNRIANLELVTRSENIRHSHRIGLRTKSTARFGTDNHAAVLTEDAVRDIRAQRGVMTHKQLAEKHGVAKATIWAIQSGKKWRQVA